MFIPLGICLTLATWLIANTLASLMTALLWQAALKRGTESWQSSRRAGLIFGVRLLPTVSALILTALVATSYFVCEPRATVEPVSLKLSVLALLSAVGITCALWRGYSTWFASRRLAANWLHRAEAVKLSDLEIPLYRFRHSSPIVAVVGAFRPRVFIASQVFDELSDDEMLAVIEHEIGHLAARDVLKRAILSVCRGALPFAPLRRTLDALWVECVEAAADERAAKQRGARCALDLAGALIKIARIMPNNAKPLAPAGAFLLGDEPQGVAERVRHLMRFASIEKVSARDNRYFLRFAPWVLPCGLSAFLLLSVYAADLHFLSAIHVLIEHVVHF